MMDDAIVGVRPWKWPREENLQVGSKRRREREPQKKHACIQSRLYAAKPSHCHGYSRR